MREEKKINIYKISWDKKRVVQINNLTYLGIRFNKSNNRPT